MQAYPHRYHAKASGQSEGGVLINGEGLPELSTQPPAEFGGPGGSLVAGNFVDGCCCRLFHIDFFVPSRGPRNSNGTT